MNKRKLRISSFFKNSGVGVGLPDTGRCIISVEEGKIHVRKSLVSVKEWQPLRRKLPVKH